MQETPPYSIVEIRILLSQYLDGALEASQMVHLDALMEQFPQYREEFLKLQATRDLLHTSFERQSEKQLHFTKVSDLVWKNIASKLEADQRATTQEYDPEFISAYYDGEISSHDPAFQQFESQLFGNVDANRLLAEMGQVSDTVKQFGYRLENNCTLDITQQVMSLFQQETGLQLASTTSQPQAPSASVQDELSSEIELLSTYVDQELSPRETIEANRLIESSESARSTLASFNQLSECIQQVSTQIQAQAPNCWPTLEPILKRPVEQGGIVIPITRKKQLQRIARIAIPTTAAAVLLLFFMPSARFDASNSVSQASLSKERTGNFVQNVVYHANTNATELASVPTESMRQRSAAFSSAREEMGSDELIPASEMHKSEPMPRPLKPLLEPSPKMAAKMLAPTAAASPAIMDAGPDQAPSSDAYLFDALNEQMPDEDISAILGK